MTHPPDENALESLIGFWSDTGMIDARGAAALAQMGRPKAVLAPSRPRTAPHTGKRPPPRRIQNNPVAEAQKLASAATSLIELKKVIEAFEGCPLKKSARNTVVCDGAANADVMLIGDAPGAEEDIKGLPFVGRSGHLMDQMLAAVGISRTANLYMTNLIFWRPSGNREPERAEVDVCSPFVRRQIELKQPKILLCAGRFAAQSLLGVDDGIMRLRGRTMEYTHDGLGASIPCIPVLHPSYLLGRPQDKAKAWNDMRVIAKLADKLGIKREAGL